jgi:hypothetical protein
VSVARTGHASPKTVAAIFILLFGLLCGEVGLIAWTYFQGQTQHQICQLVGFVGDQTQHSITTNAKILELDMKQGKARDAAIRRSAISSGTTFLIRVRNVHC